MKECNKPGFGVADLGFFVRRGEDNRGSVEADPFRRRSVFRRKEGQP